MSDADAAAAITAQIASATSLADLRAAAQRIDDLVLQEHASGTPAWCIAQHVGGLNSRLFARLWTLHAPPALVARSCLLVMGSEGRGEQILKTDQDNALLLQDGFDCPGLEAIAKDFNGGLTELGYPPCPGNIMLTNPLWRQPLVSFLDTVYGWRHGKAAAEDGPMHLAIFFDAAVVAGDATLLQRARAHLRAVLSDNDAYLARFVAAADQFHEPGNWFSRLLPHHDEAVLDLKKLGTFPIVHGVRALSLQYGVCELGTLARLTELAAQHRIGERLAHALADALKAVMQVRLSHQLRQRQRGEQPGNELRPSTLDAADRALLHDALAVVKDFRQFLRTHYQLDLI